MKDYVMRPRYATEKDWPEVEELLRASSLCVEGVREHITHYIMALDNAGLLGCAGVERFGATGLLRGLAVAQRARSAGLGELLLSAIVADVRLQGVASIVLQTKTASAYFARLGFAPINLSDLPPAVMHSQELNRPPTEVGTLMQIAL